MKLLLLAVGKVRNAAVAELCADYLARLKRFGPADVQEVKARESAKEECKLLAAALEPGDKLFVLDEHGAQMTSAQLAETLGKFEHESARRMVWALGGAFGMTDEFKKRGQLLGLSKMTLPHELCRAVALEQLYRARTIQKGLPYHHA